MRIIPVSSLLVLAACGQGTVGIGDGPSKQCPGWDISAESVVITGALLGEGTSMPITVTNNCLADEGDLTLQVSLSGSPDFTVAPADATVGPGESVGLVIIYTATGYAEASAELQIVNNVEELGTVSVPITAIAAGDQDGDGFIAVEAGGDDCDDQNAAAYPGASEVWYDGVDGDCAGDSDYDQDGDGFDRTPEGLDCDDIDSAVFPDADEIEDVVDNDCDGFVDEDSLRPGDVLVTEVMMDPVAVFDTSGEWFELLNNSGRTLDLVNWSVRDYNGDAFTVEGSLQMEPGQRIVLAVEEDFARNGGVDVDYAYQREQFDLDNVTDAIGLEVDGQVITLLEYDSRWGKTPGFSLQLDPLFEDTRSASQRAYWCISWAKLPDSEDRGTPGGVNRDCPNVDHDGDGLSVIDGDCNDADPEISPDADEIWNGIDDDCDGTVDQSQLADVESAYIEGDSRDNLTYTTSLSWGDVDHDGVGELIVGGTRIGSTVDGKVYLLDGSDASTWADVVSDVDEAVVDADHTYNAMGLLGLEQGDVDGDGKADLVIGGSSAFTSENETILLFTGGSLSGRYDSEDADATFTGLSGNYDSNRIATHLDLDGDGVNEILFSDPNANGGDLIFAGAVHLLDGAGASGGVAFEDAIERSWHGGVRYGRFGNTVDGGDLDGDGYDELVACGISESSYRGACYVVAGGSSWAASGAIADRSAFDVEGTSSATRLGYSARVAIGDFDGNADKELVLGSPLTGEALVYVDAGATTGSYDTSDADVTIRPSVSPAYFGWGLVAGDFDGDGTDDLAVGAPDMLYFSGADEKGKVWIWSGGDLDGSKAKVDDKDAWASVTGDSVSDGFGSILLAPDLEGDGVSDLVIGMPGWGRGPGRVSIILLD